MEIELMSVLPMFVKKYFLEWILKLNDVSKRFQVSQCIRSGHKVIVLMRGLAGSGKTTLAKFAQNNFTWNLNYFLTNIRKLAKLVKEDQVQIYSTDDYFVDADGFYNFDRTRLDDAHLWNQKRGFLKYDFFYFNSLCSYQIDWRPNTIDYYRQYKHRPK